MRKPLPRPLRGIVPPLVTPLADQDRLDHAGLERLVEHILAGGVHGLFVLGTTGEGPSLSHRLRCEVVERVAEQLAGRVPVLVGVTDTSFTETVELAEHAADVGATAVVLAPPYYFLAGQDELAGYVERIVPALPLPVFLYNIPSHTKLGFDLPTLERCLELPNVIGFKDSSAQLLYFNQVARLVSRRPDFSLLMGPEELLAQAMLAGAHGGVCGGANMEPGLYVGLYQAATRGDLARVRELHDRVMRISSAIYQVGRDGAAYLKGLKCALACLGLCDDTLAEPLRPFGPAERQVIARHVRDLAIGARPERVVSG